MVFVNGQAFVTTPELASGLASGLVIAHDDYHRIAPEQRALLHTLANQGYLLLSAAPGSR